MRFCSHKFKNAATALSTVKDKKPDLIMYPTYSYGLSAEINSTSLFFYVACINNVNRKKNINIETNIFFNSKRKKNKNSLWSNGTHQILFLLIVFLPVFSYSQLLFQDSTVKYPPKVIIISHSQTVTYNADLNNRYFVSLETGDSLLQNQRLRYSFDFFRKRYHYSPRLSTYITEYDMDSTRNMTYYFPSSIPNSNNYFVYFRSPSELLCRSCFSITNSENSDRKHPSLSIHGNAYYEFLYRSKIDTPFVSNHFQQHIEQVYADVVYHEKYPFRINLIARQSNSSFFKNYINLNVQFNQFAFRKNIANSVLIDIENRITASQNTPELKTLLVHKRLQYDSLKQWIDHPDRMKEIVEEKEELFYKYLLLKEDKNQKESEIKFWNEVTAKNTLQDTLEINCQEISIFDDSNLLDSLLKQNSSVLSDVTKTEERVDSLKKLIAKQSSNKLFSIKNREKIKNATQELNRLLVFIKVEKQKLDSLNGTISKVTPFQNKLPGIQSDSLQQPGFKKDSLEILLATITTKSEERLNKKRIELEEIRVKLKTMQSYFDSVKTSGIRELEETRNKLYNAKSVGDINDVIRDKNGKVLDKKSRVLLGVSQFGIGRSVVNYSELTVKNVSITGLNMEYKNSFYSAFAIGKIDYSFNDFAISPFNKIRQSLVLGRYGWLINKNKSIILTAYTGNKANYLNDSISLLNSEINSKRIMGYSLTFNCNLNNNVNFACEVAKSSAPYSGTRSMDAINKAFVFTNHDNEALSIKGDIVVPHTQSTIKAFYKNVGVNFQSYSVYTTESHQTSWGIRWQQYLWRKQLSLTAQVKQNDFDNPLLIHNYSSTSTLKSLQAVFRKRKWPLITVGYMPTTQLVKDQNGLLSENIFYSLNGSISHNYKIKSSIFNTTVFYSKFYTHGTDTGFVFFDAKSVRLNQGIQINKIAGHSAFEFYSQPHVVYYTLIQNFDFQALSFLSIGAGVKKAWVKSGKSYWGGTFQAALNVKKTGTIQVQYENEFLPDYTESGLTSNEWGHIIWIKTF